MAPPTGTVTFLFTDIEGSSRLWERFPVDMGPALARHDAILRASIEEQEGHVFKTVGDAFCAAFPSPGQALRAASTAQHRLFAEDWGATGPLRVRMGLHTGPAEFRGADYYGGTLNRVARICAAGHGGQVLASDALVSLCADDGTPGLGFRRLGEFRLRNLNRVETIYQVDVDGLPSEFPPLRSKQDLPHNLPAPGTSFIGRDDELEQIKQLLGRTRALTLLGTGGTGKTRLATEAGRELLESYADGVWLVELAALDPSASVLDAIASTLGVREEAGRTLQESLTAFLSSRQLLIILDNCEHILATASAAAAGLLAASPGLQILSTSRQALGLRGEVTLPIRPLAAFDVWRRPRDQPVTAKDVAGFDAVRLFVERARSVLPDFDLDDRNAADVARICWRLDGIPLAIELASARLRVLTPSQISDRLDDQFKLLKGGGQGVLPHQQTLRALIDWSYNLLDEQERILFHRLAVFAGGRTFEAVEAVCAGGAVDADDLLDLLQQLADKSLIFVETDASGLPRYALLESVWQYARERLDASGESEALRDRHLSYCLSVVEKASERLYGPNPEPAIRLLSSESLNIRFALEHGAERPGGVAEPLRMVTRLERYWEICGNLEEARRHVDAVLSRPDASEDKRLHAHALNCAGRIAWLQDRYQDGISLAEQGLPALEQDGPSAALGLVYGYLGFLNFSSGGPAKAAEWFEKTDAVGRATGDKRVMALALAGRGSLAAYEGRLEEALAIKIEALMQFRDIGDKWIVGYSLWGVALVALELGRAAEAREALREWAGIARDVGNKWSAAYLVQHLAEAALLEENPSLAARLFGAAEQLRQRYGIRFTPREQTNYDRAINTLQMQIPKDDLETLWQAGRHLRPEAALDLALAG